jgi:hypothetical protein
LLILRWNHHLYHHLHAYSYEYVPGSLYAIYEAHRKINDLCGWRMRSQAYEHVHIWSRSSSISYILLLLLISLNCSRNYNEYCLKYIYRVYVYRLIIIQQRRKKSWHCHFQSYRVCASSHLNKGTISYLPFFIIA